MKKSSNQIHLNQVKRSLPPHMSVFLALGFGEFSNRTISSVLRGLESTSSSPVDHVIAVDPSQSRRAAFSGHLALHNRARNAVRSLEEAEELIKKLADGRPVEVFVREAGPTKMRGGFLETIGSFSAGDSRWHTFAEKPLALDEIGLASAYRSCPNVIVDLLETVSPATEAATVFMAERKLIPCGFHAVRANSIAIERETLGNRPGVEGGSLMDKTIHCASVIARLLRSAYPKSLIGISLPSCNTWRATPRGEDTACLGRVTINIGENRIPVSCLSGWDGAHLGEIRASLKGFGTQTTSRMMMDLVRAKTHFVDRRENDVLIPRHDVRVLFVQTKNSSGGDGPILGLNFLRTNEIHPDVTVFGPNGGVWSLASPKKSPYDEIAKMTREAVHAFRNGGNALRDEQRLAHEIVLSIAGQSRCGCQEIEAFLDLVPAFTPILAA